MNTPEHLLYYTRQARNRLHVWQSALCQMGTHFHDLSLPEKSQQTNSLHLEWTFTQEQLKHCRGIIPVFSALGVRYSSRFILHWNNRHYRLCHAGNPVLFSDMHVSRVSAPDSPVESRTDYFFWNQAPDSSIRITLDVESTEKVLWNHTVMAVSFALIPNSNLDQRPVKNPGSRISLNLPAISQKQRNRLIADRICSPTAVAMVLGYYRKKNLLEPVLCDCFHPVENMFGIWSQAIYAANSQGHLGWVCTIQKIEDLILLLNKGIPIATSICYEKDQLTGAPLERTSGHLVVISGINGSDLEVFDPAAESNPRVLQVYSLDEFWKAWQRKMGLSYLIFP
jgi:hypothetical protein